MATKTIQLPKGERLQAFALVLLTLLAYAPAGFLGFIWDDNFHVTMNPTLRSLTGLWRIWSDVRATPQYYPLVHTSFWIEYHLWGLNPAGYHVVNVLLHATGVLFLWRILRRLHIPGAWLGAALFAVHPVEVESVAWISERKNVLCGVFYFASALIYRRWAFIGGDGEKSPTKKAFLTIFRLVRPICPGSPQ